MEKKKKYDPDISNKNFWLYLKKTADFSCQK